MKIQALAALKPKARLVPFTYESPPLSPYEVILKVTHCGLCHSDIHLIDDDWQRSVYPLVAGHEIIGNVVELGKSVESVKIGDRVGQSWIRSSCLNCAECSLGETNFCLNKTTTCNRHFGGFADHVVADSRFIYLIPEKLDSAHAAPLLCAGATVFSPLKRYKAHSVAIIGVGGLGHLAIQFARAFGSEVTAISSTESKEKDAHLLGATHFYTLDLLPPPNQYDLIISTVNINLNWNQILTLLKPKGTLCFLGRPDGIAPIDVSPLISFGKSITGSSTANRSDMNEMLHLAAAKNIKPLIEVMPMSQINEAIERLKSNKARYRIVLTS